jgi:cytochrome c553
MSQNIRASRTKAFNRKGRKEKAAKSARRAMPRFARRSIMIKGLVVSSTDNTTEANLVRRRSRQSRRRKIGQVVFVSSLFLLFVFCGPALGQEKSSPGATIFKSKCVLCHGPDGSGNTPLGKQLQAANLGSKEVQKQSNAELHKAVHDGKANMPAFADQLSDEEITQVVQYVRQFGKTSKK